MLEIRLRPHIVLTRTFLVQDLPEQHAELNGAVEENFLAMLLGKREPKVRLPLIGNPQNTAVIPARCAS